MKRFLLSLPILLVTSTAFAEGRYQDNGCENTDALCSMFSFLLLALGILGLGAAIYDAYKMRTDPVYRARGEQMRREYDEQRHY